MQTQIAEYMLPDEQQMLVDLGECSSPLLPKYKVNQRELKNSGGATGDEHSEDELDCSFTCVDIPDEFELQGISEE